MTILPENKYCEHCNQMHPKWINGCLNTKHTAMKEKTNINTGIHQPNVDNTTQPPTGETKDKPMEDIKSKVLKEYKKGNIVVVGSEGLQTMPIKEFVKQPTEGILYDLNRSEVVVLTFLPDPKWINDYAVAKVITELKIRINELEEIKPSLAEENQVHKNMELISAFIDHCKEEKIEIPESVFESFFGA